MCVIISDWMITQFGLSAARWQFYGSTDQAVPTKHYYCMQKESILSILSKFYVNFMSIWCQKSHYEICIIFWHGFDHHPPPLFVQCQKNYKICSGTSLTIPHTPSAHIFVFVFKSFQTELLAICIKYVIFECFRIMHASYLSQTPQTVSVKKKWPG